MPLSFLETCPEKSFNILSKKGIS